MGTQNFNAGVEIVINKIDYVILRKINERMIQIEERNSKEIHNYSLTKLEELYVNGELRFIPRYTLHDNSKYKQGNKSNFLEVSDDQWDKAKERRAYVKACLHYPNTKNILIPIIKSIWEKIKKTPKPPNPSTVIKWKNKYLEAGEDINSLVERHDKKGNKNSRYPKEVIDIITTAINTIYLKLERGTIQDAVDEAKYQVEKENTYLPPSLQLPEPTFKITKKLIYTIPAFDRYVARHGYTKAINVFRSVKGHVITKAPLERAEIDHTPLDLMVIDDNSGLPLGRPYITAIIDDFTRCILGIHIGFVPPSYLTVAFCLKHAFKPKIDLKNMYSSIENTWDAHGVMRELVVDNGLEFHSKSLEKACLTLGIEIHYAARKSGWMKGKIERLLGSLNRGVSHGNPGTTFSNIFEKEDYDSLKDAVISYKKIKEIINKWIVDYYHEKTHRTINESPINIWKSNVRQEDILLPDNLELFDSILGRNYERVLTHKGIEFSNQQYNSPELNELRYEKGEKLKVSIRVDESNLSHIHVITPDKETTIKVPALDQEYTKNLSVWQHKVIKGYARKKKQRSNNSVWLKAKHDIKEMIEEEFMTSKKKKTRMKIARFKENNNDIQEKNSQPKDCNIKNKDTQNPLINNKEKLNKPSTTVDSLLNISVQNKKTHKDNIIKTKIV